MNKRMIVWLLGALLLIESGLMLLPLVTALLYRERTGLYFLYTILGAAVIHPPFAAKKWGHRRVFSPLARSCRTDFGIPPPCSDKQPACGETAQKHGFPEERSCGVGYPPLTIRLFRCRARRFSWRRGMLFPISH